MSDRRCKNWLKSYLEYTKKSEAPERYHLWCGVSAIAATLQRKVWLDMGLADYVYPNMYIVLVGPPATRKGTAMKLAIGLLGGVPDAKTGSDSITREALINAIDKSKVEGEIDGKMYVHSSLTIVSKELSVFLGVKNLELLAFLTDIFDCHNEWEYRTKNMGTNSIVGVWLNLLAGTTPLWLTGSVPMDAIGGGFTSRVVFVVEYKARCRTSLPLLSPAERRLKEDLMYDLGQISLLKGGYEFSASGFKWYDNWYQTRNEALADDLRFAGYVERKHIHLIKVAIIIAAATTDKRVIEQEHLQTAYVMLDDLEDNMLDAFGGSGRNILAPDIDLILQFISENKRLSRQQLLRSVWRDVNTKEVDTVINILVDMQKIKKDIIDGIVYYVPCENKKKRESDG